MKTNYQFELLNLLKNMDAPKKLLLHSCCGPCSTQVISFLAPYFDITILYYNPNIEPIDEYLKRKLEQRKFIDNFKSLHKLDMYDIDYDNESFIKASGGLENELEGGLRCHACFYLRLNKTALIAKDKGYDYFGTTLTVSPHKNSQVINEIGLEISKEKDIPFLVGDFKKDNGYLKSIAYSKEYDLYRQDYCGCHFSNWHIDK